MMEHYYTLTTQVVAYATVYMSGIVSRSMPGIINEIKSAITVATPSGRQNIEGDISKGRPHLKFWRGPSPAAP